MGTPRRYAEIGLVDFHSFSTLSQGDEHQTPVTFDLGQQVPVLHEQGGLLGTQIQYGRQNHYLKKYMF